MTRKRLIAALIATLVLSALAGAGLVVRQTFFGPKTITAYFTSATAIYPGDDVRISGVKVGTIAAIDTTGTQARLTLDVDHGVRVPADAKAVIVAQNLISARYVQLAPAFKKGSAELADGAVIGIERTAVPVEWDEVKTQLTRLATELGPKPGEAAPGTSVSRFIDSAAGALDGNGEKLRQTLAQLSGLGRILADGSGDIVGTIEGLQNFISVLRDSNTQIVQFQSRLATLSDVLDGSRSDLDEALTKLSSAIDDVKRFVAGSRNQTSEQVQRLANVTQTLVDHREDLENLLLNAPNAFANAYNIYNPDSGSFIGAFVLQNFANPLQLLCAGIGSVENATAPETAKLCEQYLGPALRLLNFNYLPIPVNPLLMPSASPDRIVYSPPSLAPGGTGPTPGPPDVPPAISAYTGLDGDVPPPPGYVPLPEAVSGPPPTLPELLLPAEAPPP
ncbi:MULTISPECIES: MCE family protein [unclassified Mycobacterium]|uniref:MCE family protein n=1 Tax=unclassified Mycobacterium TaxID=2642494 RepID=UPI0029C7780A|nr:MULTISPECIES: MCE family protein [unclassified Mycobacterium]